MPLGRKPPDLSALIRGNTYSGNALEGKSALLGFSTGVRFRAFLVLVFDFNDAGHA